MGGMVTTISAQIAAEAVVPMAHRKPGGGGGGSRSAASYMDFSICGARRRLQENNAADDFDPDGGAAARRLGGAGVALPAGSVIDCDHQIRLRATVIFTINVATMLFALIFTLIGRLHLTCMVQFILTSLVEVFLSCVGSKVFLYGVKMCNYDPKQFLPAIMVGVPLYFAKAYHIGNPVIVLPAGLITPLVIFYLCTFASGSGLQTPRYSEDRWMFEEMPDLSKAVLVGLTLGWVRLAPGVARGSDDDAPALHADVCALSGPGDPHLQDLHACQSERGREASPPRVGATVHNRGREASPLPPSARPPDRAGSRGISPES